MLAQEIEESSGYSFEGSWTPDLVFSKLWLARELKRILAYNQVTEVPTIYVLGSWWGNMSVILNRAAVPVDKIINVDNNRKWLKGSQQLTQAMDMPNVQTMKADANQLDYRQLEGPSVVINASLNYIKDRGWFGNIPDGTLVALQGRDQANSVNVYHSPEDIEKQYPLDSVLYAGSMRLEDPETDYTRHMVIGVKGRPQLDELTFLGSPCTKDCSGHRAGYAWSKARGGIQSASWSRSFNNGAALAAAGR